MSLPPGPVSTVTPSCTPNVQSSTLTFCTLPPLSKSMIPITRCTNERGRNCNTRGHASSPSLPQLLPHLDQRLHLSRAGETVVNQAAVALRFFVETPHRWKTKVRQTVAKLLEMLRAQHLRISPVRSPSHDPLWYQLRRLFAIRTVMTRYEKEKQNLVPNLVPSLPISASNCPPRRSGSR